MLRENPSYAQLYLQIALEEIYEDQDPCLSHCTPPVIESRGGIGEIAAKAGLSASSYTEPCLIMAIQH